MNLRQYVNPADGMVELETPDGKTIRRWPIDARGMIEKGGAKPVAVRAATGAPAPALAAAPSKPTSAEADDE